jgi:hypothetical protein
VGLGTHPPTTHSHSNGTPFSTTFTQALRLLPIAIPNSTRSSAFAHSTGLAGSVHWPSDLDVPTTSWGAPFPDPCFPVNFFRWASHSSLSGSVRVPSTDDPSIYSVPLPFHHYPHTDSDPLSSPASGRHGCYIPFGRPPTMSPPTSPPMSPVPPSAPMISPSQTESVVGSIRRISLSPFTERTHPSSAVPPPPAFARMPADEPSLSTPSVHLLN